MPTSIVLIRHAETSRPHQFHGAESDVGLGERGRVEASNLARALAGEPVDLVACSSMRRAIETASPAAEALGLPLMVVPALRERRMPSLSGREKAEALPLFEATMARWMAGDLDHGEGPDDESYAQLRDRVMPAWRDLAAEALGRSAVVVAHGLVIRVLLAELLPSPGVRGFDRIGIDHCARNILVSEGRGWAHRGLNLPIGGPVVS